MLNRFPLHAGSDFNSRKWEGNRAGASVLVRRFPCKCACSYPWGNFQKQNGWVKWCFPLIFSSHCQTDLHKGSANLHPHLRPECQAVVFNLKTPGKEELLSKMKIWRKPCECLPQRAAPAGFLGKNAEEGPSLLRVGGWWPGRLPPSGGGGQRPPRPLSVSS